MNEHEVVTRKLAERREELGIPIRDAYARTHIPLQYLEALEACDVDALPASCYALGFLKTYCSFLGLDAEPFLAEYQSQTQALAGRRRRTRVGGSERPSWMADTVAWFTVCAIIALGWLTYTVVVRPNAEPLDGRVEAGEIRLPPPPGGETR